MELEEGSFFGFEREVYIAHLPFEEAKKYFKKEYVEKIESGQDLYRYVENIYETTQDMLDYLIFGYMKALNQRGISASRTINKMAAYMFILGREDLEKLVSDENLYSPYGMPALVALTEALGLEVPDNVREFASDPSNAYES
jgi:hypothetical protein